MNEATSPGGMAKGSRPRIQALSPASLYNKKRRKKSRSLEFIAMSIPKTNKALVYKDNDDKMQFSQRKKQKKTDCVCVDVREALLHLRGKTSLQEINSSTDSDEKEDDNESFNDSDVVET